ncbi:TIM barrel protein [Actinophytocola oryzae]|uniref:2-keto-myo-inositol dehydratase n=1 Tax=Actinophytocola oryzae TaxID=502181 RepID=A0A4V3FQK3_9PSEU|nr:TIM barrel protein [Actinophytocola oryzae]TDV40021.1 2-keto-myo-inositol dehydratase [Actinophytocola oryzae]
MNRVAGAPISWGVCEVPGWGRVLPVETVLAEMAGLGLTATELGPPGYLPTTAPELRGALAEHDLGLVGGFYATPLHLTSTVDDVVDLIAGAGGEVLVLAAATGLDGYDERPALSDREWAALVANASHIAERAAAAGLRTVLHPHVGTHVETRAEVERFVHDSDLPLCVDTGHLLIGGTDPVDLVRRHPHRVGHVHLKDVRADLAERVRQGAVTYTEAVALGIYVPLGAGDVDLDALLRTLRDNDYDGWYVLEQDTALRDDRLADGRPREHTRQSLEHLAKLWA